MQFQPNGPAPFLKWAGGKRALLHEIVPNIPDFNGRYIEPFLGAGSVFFQIPAHVEKVASDQNAELIDAYRVVRDYPDELIEKLRSHKNDKEYFLSLRELDRRLDYPSLNAVDRAARLIYLNKTCFNGLYRVNSKGHFNVPFGNQRNPDIVSESQIRAASAFLSYRSKTTKSQFAATLLAGDYSQATRQVIDGDFVYLDPPYNPVSATSSFVSYGVGGFTSEDQFRLRDEVLRLHQLGAKVLISNSDSPLIHDLYSSSEFSRKLVPVRRAISAKAKGRGQIHELLIANYRMA
jgi:DNA adenine methylase